MRLFVAIPVPEGAAWDFFQSYSEYPGKKNVKPVPPQNYHITISFIGDVKKEKSESLITELENVLKDVKPFQLIWSFIGPGPTKKQPRLIWLKSQRSDPFYELSVKITSCTNKFMDKPDRVHSAAHVTLGRFKKNTRPPRDLPDLSAESLAAFPVGSVCLFKSELKPGGAEYSALQVFHLK